MSSPAPEASPPIPPTIPTPKTLWDSIDKPIQRTAWILGIVTAVLLLAEKYILPNLGVSILVFQSVMTAVHFYFWRTKPYYLLGFMMQHLFVFTFIISIGEGYRLTHADDVPSRLMGAIWYVLAGCYAILSLRAAYERDKYYDKRSGELLEFIKQHSEFFISHIGLHNKSLELHNSQIDQIKRQDKEIDGLINLLEKTTAFMATTKAESVETKQHLTELSEMINKRKKKS